MSRGNVEIIDMRALGAMFRPFSASTAMGTSKTALRESLVRSLMVSSCGLLLRGEDDDGGKKGVDVLPPLEVSSTATRVF